MTSTRPAVLFDVDGTLLDTNYFHTVSWWQALREAGEDIAMARIHPLIGMGSDQLLTELLGEEREGYSDLHAKYYTPFNSDLHAFPKAADLLAEVAGRGAQVVLATSSKKEDLDKLLTSQRDRLDALLSTPRTWPVADFTRLYLGHPRPHAFGAEAESLASGLATAQRRGTCRTRNRAARSIQPASDPSSAGRWVPEEGSLSAARAGSDGSAPVRMMPLSMISAASSGGVSWNTSLIALIMSRSSREIARTISFVRISVVRGRPEIKSRPLISILSSSSSGSAEPICIFTSSAVFSPMARFLFQILLMLSEARLLNSRTSRFLPIWFG